MATKKEVLEMALRGEGCLGKAKDDEPVFVLVGDDMLAVSTIQYWLHRMMMFKHASSVKVDDANETIKAFQVWGGKHGTKVPD